MPATATEQVVDRSKSPNTVCSPYCKEALSSAQNLHLRQIPRLCRAAGTNKRSPRSQPPPAALPVFSSHSRFEACKARIGRQEHGSAWATAGPTSSPALLTVATDCRLQRKMPPTEGLHLSTTPFPKGFRARCMDAWMQDVHVQGGLHSRVQ